MQNKMSKRQDRPSRTPQLDGKHFDISKKDRKNPGHFGVDHRQSHPTPLIPPAAATLTDREYAYLWQTHARAPERPGISPPTDLYWQILNGEVSVARPAAQTFNKVALNAPASLYVPPMRRSEIPHARQSRATHAAPTPCFAIRYPKTAQDVFCREDGSLNPLCTDYIKTKLMNNNTEYITTCLASTIGPQAAYDTLSLPQNNGTTYKLAQVVEISRCTGSPSPENVETFYCVVDGEASTKAQPCFRVLPKETPMCELPVTVHGKNAKLENLWILTCEKCPRCYIISVYLE